MRTIYILYTIIYNNILYKAYINIYYIYCYNFSLTRRRSIFHDLTVYEIMEDSTTGSQFMISSAAISFVALSITLFAFYLRRELLAKNYHRLVFCTILTEYFGTIPGLVGLQSRPGPNCTFQWFFTNFFQVSAHVIQRCIHAQLFHTKSPFSLFQLATMMYALVILYELYSTVVFGEPLGGYRNIHIVIWVTCLLATLLPLSTLDIGPYSDLDWCYLKISGTICH